MKCPELTTINNVAIRLLPSDILIHSTTLIPGASASITSGKPDSLDASNKQIMNDDSDPILKATLQPTTINNEAVQPLPTGVSIHSITLMPGASALIVESIFYSLDSSSNLRYEYKIEASIKSVVMGAGIIAIAEPLIPASRGVGAFEYSVQTSRLILGGIAS